MIAMMEKRKMKSEKLPANASHVSIAVAVAVPVPVSFCICIFVDICGGHLALPVANYVP